MTYDSEYEDGVLGERVELLETVVNNIQVAITKLATSSALSQIMLIKQKEIDDIQADITWIKNQITIIKAEVFK